MTAGVNAFAYGAWSVNTDVIVDVGITGRWYLPEAEEQGAGELEALGCDVIGGYTDGNAGAARAAADGHLVVAAGVENEEIYGGRAIAYALYDWTEYFSLKLSQVIGRDITGEAWAGDYYGGEAVFALRDSALEEILAQAADRLQQWNPNIEVEETEAEEQTEPAATQEETELETEPEETIAPPEVDEETGYLSNVRVHYIEVKEPETTEAEE